MSNDGRRRANVELKARLAEPWAARRVCRELGAEPVFDARQTDTYFSLGAYRMKLRESSRGDHELIWYSRENRGGARRSSYRVLPVSDPAEKKRIFAASMGVKAVVVKTRSFFLWRGVRIHLDRVEDLGDFIEFEAVLGGEMTEEVGRRSLAFLRERFGIEEGDLVGESYSDLPGARLRRAPGPGRPAGAPPPAGTAC